MPFFNLFLIAILLLVGAFAFSLALGSLFIVYSRHFFQTKTREYLPQNHQKKGLVPSMGGIFVLAAACCCFELLFVDFCPLSGQISPYCDLTLTLVILFAAITFCCIGFSDDWSKIRHKKGIFARTKMLAQLGAGFITALLLIFSCNVEPTITLPSFPFFSITSTYLYLIWATFIIVGTSNAVNLTDGLDGLAIGSLIPNFLTFGVLNLLLVPGNLTVAAWCFVFAGASLGFYWYNRHPARIFMGDCGSLFLGATLATIALLNHQEFLLIITGVIFVVETLSVMAQVLSVRYRGKRILKMSPIHHHFELSGVHETVITRWFTAVTWVACAVSVMIYINCCCT